MSFEARVQALLTKADAGDVADAGSASEAENASAPLDGASESGAESASADEGQASTEPVASPEAPTPEAEAIRLKHAQLEEKLEALREERRIRREQLDAETAAAKKAREEAEADRKAAAEEKARYDGLKKKGSIRETIAALGFDPRESYEAMKQEALEAGSPEAIERRWIEKWEADRAALEKKFEESLSPLKQKIESLEKEREELAQQASEAQFASDYQRDVSGEKYLMLRAEYSDATLLALARRFRDNPDSLAEEAQRVGLTDIPKRFNMTHILEVLRATQERHQRRTQENLAKLRPQAPAAINGAPKTVNGTTEKRNAGSALGNDLASSRASGAPEKPRLTWEQRVSKLAGDR